MARKNGEGPTRKGTKDPLLAELHDALSAPIPSELQAIYGDKTIPAESLGMYEKLKGKEKRESYLAKLRTDEAERKVREEVKLPAVAQLIPTGLAPELLHAVEKSEADRREDSQSETERFGAVQPASQSVELPQPVADTSLAQTAQPGSADKIVVEPETVADPSIENFIIEKCTQAALSESRRGFWRNNMLSSLGEGYDIEFILPPPDGWRVAVIFQLVNREYGYVVPLMRVSQKNLSEWFKTDDTDELISALVTPAHVARDSGAPGGWRVLTGQKGKVRCDNSATIVSLAQPAFVEKTVEVPIVPTQTEPAVAEPAPVTETPKAEADFLSQAEVDQLLRGIPLAGTDEHTVEVPVVPVQSTAEERKHWPGGVRPAGSTPIIPQGKFERDDTAEADGSVEPTLEHSHKQKSDPVDFMSRQADILEELNVKYPDGIPPNVYKQLTDFGDLYNANRESGANPKVEAELKTRRESFMASEGIQFDYHKISTDSDGTALEHKNKFLEVMARAREMFDSVAERFTKSKNYLNERAKKLDAEADGSSGERIVRRMGEIYNKLNWREKLGIGLVLGASAVVTGGASIYLPYAFVGLIGVQRAFGMASMYLSQEKELLNAKVAEFGQVISVKERAAINAALSGALMGAAIGKGIQFANEYGLVERTREWLGSMMGHNSVPAIAVKPEVQAPAIVSPAPEAPAPEVVAPQVPPASEAVATEVLKVPETAPAAGAGKVVAPIPEATELSGLTEESPGTPQEMPNVEATKGKGYEYMMKRMWEQLQEKGLSAEDYPENSDVRQLLEASPENINKVIHELATDNEFYKADGTNVRIDLGDKMSFDNDGNITLNKEVFAPEDAKVTPVYHPEAQTHPEVQPLSDISDAPRDVDVVGDTVTPEEQVAPAESPAPPAESGGATAEISGAPSEIITNQHGLEIRTAEPHLYNGVEAGNKFIFGGTHVERVATITEYLKKDPFGVIFGPDRAGTQRVPWFLSEGKFVVSGPPMKTPGFLGLGLSLMKPPGPEDLKTFIK